MGIMDFLSELGMDDEIKYNFNVCFIDFKKRYPDIVIYREHKIKPCPHYIMYEKNDGKRFAEFFYSYTTRRKRWEALNNGNDGPLKFCLLNHMELNKGFSFPERSNDLPRLD